MSPSTTAFTSPSGGDTVNGIGAVLSSKQIKDVGRLKETGSLGIMKFTGAQSEQHIYGNAKSAITVFLVVKFLVMISFSSKKILSSVLIIAGFKN